MPYLLLNFQHRRDAWTSHFLRDACRTGIGSWTRFYNVSTLDTLCSFVGRCNPEDAILAGFDHSVMAWGRGSEYVHLTDEQYSKLR